ncbi:ABC transporter substrate-binding protein, partial [Psychrobacter sp. TB55-MNA-CIBAN-0194]
MSMIKDTNTELSMFKKGELDWAGSPTGSLPTESLKTLKKEGGLEIQTIAGIYNYKFNTKVKPLNNANIRKA